jgi:predicted glutamine amidotransferase
MCGIIGYITTDDKTRTLTKEKFMREGLYANALRGMDSTGIMSVHDEFQWAWQKQAVPAYDFIRDKGFIERNTETWCSVGHGRAATVGKVLTENAHPFKQEDIILVHNGTLRSTYYLPHQCRDLEVDSERLCYNLSQVAPEDAHEILTKVQGAYALVWFDIRDETVNFARNSERPFHMGVNSAEDLLLFASDGHMLNFIASRFHDYTARPANIWSLGTEVHLKYRKGCLVPEVKEIAPFVQPTRSWNMGMAPNYSDQTTSGQRAGTSSSGSPIGSTLTRPAGKAAELGKVKIANEYRRIPKAHSEMVTSWYGLTHGEDMFFEPHDFIQWGMTESNGMIYGQLYHEEWDTWFDARVTEVTKFTQGLYGDKPWTVHVIGVDHSDIVSPKGGCTFMCVPVRYEWTGGDSAERNKQAEFIETLTDKMQEEDPVGPPWNIPGPRGNITEEGYFTLVQDGCVQCGQPLFIEDADDIIWVGEMCNQPMCGECLEHATLTVH